MQRQNYDGPIMHARTGNIFDNPGLAPKDGLPYFLRSRHGWGVAKWSNAPVFGIGIPRFES